MSSEKIAVKVLRSFMVAGNMAIADTVVHLDERTASMMLDRGNVRLATEEDELTPISNEAETKAAVDVLEAQSGEALQASAIADQAAYDTAIADGTLTEITPAAEQLENADAATEKKAK